MHKGTSVGAIWDFRKAVDVKLRKRICQAQFDGFVRKKETGKAYLANERLVSSLSLKVSFHNRSTELVNVVDFEGIALGKPRDDLLQLRVRLGLLKEIVELGREGMSLASNASTVLHAVDDRNRRHGGV